MYLVNLSQDKSQINSYLSNTLLEKIEKQTKENKKIILYLNKRGEYSSLICNSCNHLYKCKNCDVSMSVHKYPEKLICHICKEVQNIPNKCEKCGKETLQKVGIGTQQIEDALKKIYPNKNIFRFDTDTTKNKTQKKEALENLNKADIIIGTKMITTGFDFKGVGLIGIILLEQELLIPKYNTEEKVYLNIKQLIGRGNRSGEKSDIIIQTFIPENEIIKSITQDNYKDFFIKTLNERKLFNYPPYTQMLSLEYRHKDKNKAFDFIRNLKNKLDLLNIENKKDIILTPNPSKKYNQYYYKIIIKGDNLREFINNIKTEIMRNSNLVVIFD